MGRTYGAICTDCSERFKVNDGPGMNFLLLHCDRCGAELSVEVDDWERERVHEGCAGHFTSEAPARCPRCKSTNHRQDYDEPEIMYD